VAAYGPDRPVAENDTPAGRATNRRIDLRFIMVTPPDTEGIEVIRQALRNFRDITP
jgi:chemotaxis protein MotB